MQTLAFPLHLPSRSAGGSAPALLRRCGKPHRHWDTSSSLREEGWCSLVHQHAPAFCGSSNACTPSALPFTANMFPLRATTWR